MKNKIKFNQFAHLNHFILQFKKMKRVTTKGALSAPKDSGSLGGEALRVEQALREGLRDVHLWP